MDHARKRSSAPGRRLRRAAGFLFEGSVVDSAVTVPINTIAAITT